MQEIAPPLKTTREESGLKPLIRSLGPGVMMAAAAVGGSHLVSSTKAGAIYGWQLMGLILLVNLLKYPFFRAGIQYTLGTGNNLIQGYRDMGRGYLWLFAGLVLISGIVNTAALLLFSANLLGYFLPFKIPVLLLASFILAVCLIILLAGHYKTLSTLSKIIMSVLVVTTLAALFMVVAGGGVVKPTNFHPPSPWSFASIGFMVIMMGWMPAPIEISAITSLWLRSQQSERKVTAQSALFDFNLGYIGTALLAVAFMALGALVLNGNGEALATSGIDFSRQLVSMYASVIGEWSRYLIAFIAFSCIFGSTITVIDGYARSVAEAQQLLKKKVIRRNKNYYLNGWILIISLVALGILVFFISALMDMLNFAMILAFLTTPIFAAINYLLVKRTRLPNGLSFNTFNRFLSWAGLVYLFGFLIVFIVWKWVI